MARNTLKRKGAATLAEKAKKDKESGAGVGRGNKMERTREIFKSWLLLPRQYLGAGEPVLRALGIIDADTVELYNIKSQAEFAAKFSVAEPTLSRWRGEMERNNDFGEFKREMRSMTKNVMGALYRKAMSDADAARVKLWLQVVEGWHEGLYMVPEPSEGLSDEEKASLDRLIAKFREE